MTYCSIINELRAKHRQQQEPSLYSSAVFFVDVRKVVFVVFIRSCRAIQGGFLLLAMLCSYLVSDTWPLPSLSRSTGYLGFLLLAMLRSCLVSDTWPLPSFSRSTGHTRSICLSLSARKQGPQASGHSRSKC